MRFRLGEYVGRKTSLIRLSAAHSLRALLWLYRALSHWVYVQLLQAGADVFYGVVAWQRAWGAEPTNQQRGDGKAAAAAGKGSVHSD
jgi:hypothetical protein